MQINYEAEYTPSIFHASEAFVRGIKGPIGSGKSVACVMEILRVAMQQAPDENGIRPTRWAVIRNTYPELKSTTIKTYQDWMDQDFAPIKWDAPITSVINLPLPDGTRIECEVLFLALDKPKDVKKLLSLELTGAWINEAREVDLTIVNAATSRVGRYPAKRRAPISWAGVIMDTNPPDDDHWWYRYAVNDEWKIVQEGCEDLGEWEFFDQPGALLAETDPVSGKITKFMPNPKAENVRHQPLGYKYWFQQLGGKDSEWIKAMVLGQYASIFDGKPVYDGSFNETLHCSEHSLELYKGIPIRLGWDFGLTPSCIVGQLSPNGQLRILREYVCERGGIRQFAQQVVKPALLNEFHGYAIISHGDPAGAAAMQVDEELTCIGELCGMGIPTEEASTNDFMPRRQAVMNVLNRIVDGRPGMIIDPSCKILRRGFNGGYKFDRVQIAGSVSRFKDKPSKNQFSHPHDALQYLCLGLEVSNDSVNRSVLPMAALAALNSRGWGGI